MKKIWGRRMENGGFRAQNWAIKIWGFHHITPTFHTYVSLCPLPWITLFWGHCRILSFPLEDDLQLFPGLSCLIWIVFFFIKSWFLSRKKRHQDSQYCQKIWGSLVLVMSQIWRVKKYLKSSIFQTIGLILEFNFLAIEPHLQLNYAVFYGKNKYSMTQIYEKKFFLW